MKSVIRLTLALMAILLSVSDGWPQTPADANVREPQMSNTVKANIFADKRNIVFMLSNDQGWNGLSVPMHPDTPASKGQIFYTPNLERFASQGMRFSSAYASAPVCLPTRISLQTGKSPALLHWTKAAPVVTGRKLTEPRLIMNLSKDETTIGELLKKAGYATAPYGKWHIAGGGPGALGYDEHDGDTGNENASRAFDEIFDRRKSTDTD